VRVLDGLGVAERAGEVDVGAVEVERLGGAPPAEQSSAPCRMAALSRCLLVAWALPTGEGGRSWTPAGRPDVHGLCGHMSTDRAAIDTVIFCDIGLRGGVSPVRRCIPELIPDVLSTVINLGRVFDYATGLDGIADAYTAMRERRAIESMLRISSPAA
jgi:hypothetical protein